MATKIKVKFLVNNTPLYTKKIESSLALSEIRKNLNIDNEYIFQTNNGFDILKEDEKDYTVEDSLVDNDKILLKNQLLKLKRIYLLKDVKKKVIKII